MPLAYIVLLKNLLKHIRGRLLSTDTPDFSCQLVWPFGLQTNPFNDNQLFIFKPLSSPPSMNLVVLGHTFLYVGMYNSSLLNWFSPNTKNSGNMGNCPLFVGGGEI